MLEKIVIDALTDAQSCLSQALSNSSLHKKIVQASQCIVNAFQNNGKVISCGNGGSMSDAMHFAEELSGKFRENRKALPAIAISDPGHLSCVANDFGYERVFSRFIEAHFSSKDVLLAISTSGNSANVIEAAKAASSKGGKIIALTGGGTSELEKISDIPILTPGSAEDWADRVQEMHIKVIHIMIQLIEAQLFESIHKC
ncbi:MAG: SIS domain-containing protein [Gammaproteobacteria bacterium]